MPHFTDNVFHFAFQKCGIESLVDELCQKLKDFESDAVAETSNYPSARRESAARCDSAADPAAKYYAAFPALGSAERHRHHCVRLIGDTRHARAAHFGEATFLAGDEGYSTNSDHETCDTAPGADLEPQDLDLEYEDLPVDIRGLLASPVTPPTSLHRRARQVPLAAAYIRCGTNITSSIWSQDVEEIVQQHAQPSPSAEAARWSDGGDRRTVSYMQLNHGCEASCFAEVPPGVSVRRNPLSERPSEPPPPPPPVTTEEDLLTSARTHFRPIRQEVGSSVQASHAYADGTTFAIRGSLERVPYRRTDSGTLYLQQDTSSSPERYLEWRSSDGREPPPQSDFVLRFRVKQNDKCCQTDEEDEVSELEVAGGEETPPPKKRVLSESSCCELYFPGDCGELLLHEQWQGCAQCSTGEVWGATCTACAPQLPEKRTAHRRDLRRLRDELSREGDQLLSDLQRVVQLPEPPPPDHRKRRHSGAPAAAQRCSLLRPVTL